jgi:renalase
VRALVVGAGMAGLTAARRLHLAGHDVVVVDKGRGVGGRMATRRIGDAVLDHGAQFFTAPDPTFAARVAEWRTAGVVHEWFSARLVPDGTTVDDGHPRLRGATGMAGIAKHLAARLPDVRVGSRVIAVAASPGGWRADLEDGPPLVADAVVLTPPVPQTLDLLTTGGVVLDPADAVALGRVRYDSCVTVLAVLDRPSGLPEPGAVRPAGEPVDWAGDNQRKGISSVPAVTIHLGPRASAEAWTRHDAEIVADALTAVPIDPAVDVVDAQVHRWRYARPSVLHPEPALRLAGLPAAVCAGDAFAAARVEGAALSGTAAVDLLAGPMSQRGRPLR